MKTAITELLNIKYPIPAKPPTITKFPNIPEELEEPEVGVEDLPALNNIPVLTTKTKAPTPK